MRARKTLISLLACVLLAIATGNAAAADNPTATYQVTLERTWSQSTHPLDWPGDAAHFSGGIGAVHDAHYALYAAQGIATPGLEILSQRGRTTPYDAELAAARAQGRVGGIFQLQPVRSVGGQSRAQFTASDDHPLVSLAAMVAPSPDWFTGISAIALKRDGHWIDSATLTLYAWDSGTNNATTYRAPKIAAVPLQPIALNDAPMFVQDGKRIPVGTVTLRRIAAP